jgi:hypothetical protein
MLEALRLWLNGDKEYWTGLVLYSKLQPDLKLIELMKEGETPFTRRRLNEEILAACNHLKSTNHTTGKNENHNTTTTTTRKAKDGNDNAQYLPSQKELVASNKEPINPTLYQACKLKADNTYKEAMNLRAILFQSAIMEGFEDPNRPDLVQKRSKMAVDVVALHQKASKLYEIADYVLLHGVLPNEAENHHPDTEMDALPDSMVKPTLDNLRKNINKIKKREATPERVALLQQHQINLNKLEARWHLLKLKQ